VTEDPPPTEDQQEAVELFAMITESPIDVEPIVPPDTASLDRIEKCLKVPSHFDSERASNTLQEVRQEITSGYTRAVKQSVLEYLIMDPIEKARLGLEHLPAPPLPRMYVFRIALKMTPRRIRAPPVSMRLAVLDAKRALERCLHVMHPVLPKIVEYWAEFRCDLPYRECS